MPGWPPNAPCLVGHFPCPPRPSSRRQGTVQRSFQKEILKVRTCPWASWPIAYRTAAGTRRQAAASVHRTQGRESGGHQSSAPAPPNPPPRCWATLPCSRLQLTSAKITGLKEMVSRCPTSPKPISAPLFTPSCDVLLGVGHSDRDRTHPTPTLSGALTARGGQSCWELRGGGGLPPPPARLCEQSPHVPGCSQRGARRPSSLFCICAL